MSLSLRRERVRVFGAPTETIDLGVTTRTYALADSGESDKAWPASRGMPGGREVTTAQQANYKADAVFGLDDFVPVVNGGALRDMRDQRVYLITGVQPAPNAGELQVLAANASDATINLTGE